jgi:hypothetical protein
MVMGVMLAAGGGAPWRGLGEFAAAVVCRCGRSRCGLACRLYLRLIRVGSLTFAYYRMDFPVQVKNVAGRI